MREIDHISEVHSWLRDTNRRPATFLRIDLVDLEDRLGDVSLAECVFLSCTLAPGTIEKVTSARGFIIAERQDVPFVSLRNTLYRTAEIYEGFDPNTRGSWESGFDHVAYLWFMNPRTKLPKSLGFADMLAARLHDAAMERSIARFLHHEGLPAVAIMGGHDRMRDDAAYTEIAKLARELRRRDRMIVTGGGPGFMEAANLGAFLAPFPDDTLDQAMAILIQVPDFRHKHAWLATACEVRAGLLGDWKADASRMSHNLGLPTWLFGHHPPNLFATHIGKFFYNSLREDGLVTVADGGIIFAEGNAGTVQEVFQDATHNYYRPAGTAPTPMVLFNSTEEFWDAPDTGQANADRQKPILPVVSLLRQLSKECAGGPFDQAVLVTGEPAEIVQFLTASPAAALSAEQSRGKAWRTRLIDQNLHDLNASGTHTE